MSDVFFVEQTFVERTVNHDRLKVVMHDELSLHRVAANVPLGRFRQLAFGRLTNHETKVEIAVDNLVNGLAANLEVCTGAESV